MLLLLLLCFELAWLGKVVSSAVLDVPAVNFINGLGTESPLPWPVAGLLIAVAVATEVVHAVYALRKV
jgi:hypothetical protein